MASHDGDVADFRISTETKGALTSRATRQIKIGQCQEAQIGVQPLGIVVNTAAADFDAGFC